MKNNITLIVLFLFAFFGMIATVINMIWVIIEITERLIHDIPFDWMSVWMFLLSLALLIFFTIFLIEQNRKQQKAKFLNRGNKSFEDYINRLKDEENA